jgi:hypothetical protein
MGVTRRMTEKTKLREQVQDKLYREERNYRADRLVEKWSRIPEVGSNIKSLNESGARNLALHLENQARFMSRMSEAQLSTSFSGLSPENMLRLVRLAYPNTIRNKLFTEFAMESAKDSIKYIRPVATKTATGYDMGNRTFESDWNFDGSNDVNSPDYRKALYEITEDRYAQELANGLILDVTAPATITVGGTDYNLTDTGRFVIFGKYDDGTTVEEIAEFRDMGYIDGYATLFEDEETQPVAAQVKTGAAEANSGTWMINPSKTITVTPIGIPGVFKIDGADAGDVLKAYGRFNSEGDFKGDYLGEVELVMTDYWFRPRPTVLGVTWSQLTELVLDTSFGVTAEELLVDYAGQEIKKALDYRAVKIAYQAAKMNGAAYTVVFDAEAGSSNDDSYLHTAQTISQAIERIGDIQFNDINRGGVTRIVGGPAAITYLRLNAGFSTKGAQSRIGGHQVGELYGIPVFKVPSSIIPDNELLCIWRNDENEADVSVAFGTLVPFFSTGSIQRKNLYKEAALASYGDWAVLNKKYLGLIKIEHLRQLP